MADFGYGVRGRGHYQIWDTRRFKDRFSTASGLRSDQDIRAIIYAMGGPFPSELKDYSFSSNEDGTEIWIKLNLCTQNP